MDTKFNYRIMTQRWVDNLYYKYSLCRQRRSYVYEANSKAISLGRSFHIPSCLWEADECITNADICPNGGFTNICPYINIIPCYLGTISIADAANYCCLYT